MAEYNDFGEEIPDDVPVEIPLRFRRQRPPSIQELIALYVRNEQALARASGRAESVEEEDFDVDDDGNEDIMTPYELHALAADTEREYASRARKSAQKEKRDGERVESGAGAGSDRKGDGKGEGSKAGSADSKDAGGARAEKDGVAPEG